MNDCEAALARLCDPQAKVSAHYLIHRSGDIVQLVDDARARLARRCLVWRGETDMNAASIGIELDHNGHDGKEMSGFPSAQMDALVKLLRS